MISATPLGTDHRTSLLSETRPRLFRNSAILKPCILRLRVSRTTHEIGGPMSLTPKTGPKMLEGGKGGSAAPPPLLAIHRRRILFQIRLRILLRRSLHHCLQAQ